MFVGMVTRYATSPETVLTQMVIVTPLTLVPEAHERLPMAALTLDRVEHWKCGMELDGFFVLVLENYCKGIKYALLYKFSQWTISNEAEKTRNTNDN